MPTEVTDPSVLAQLNGQNAPSSQGEVTDPAILSQLNGAPQDQDQFAIPTAPAASFVPQRAPYPTGGFWQNALSGARKLYSDMGLGGAELYSRMFEPDISGVLQQEAAQQRTEDQPLMSTWGGRIGYGAATLPMFAIPGAATIPGAAAVGAATGALTPTTEGESIGHNALWGAGANALTAGVTRGLGGWLTRRATGSILPESGLTAAQQEAADQGAGLGMSLTPGQQSGNRALLQFEEKLRGQPASSGPFNRIDEANQAAGDAAAARSIGVNAPNLDTTVFRQAIRRFNRIFTAARSPNVSVPVGDDTMNFLASAGDDLTGSARDALARNPEVQNLTNYLGASPTAQQLGTLSSRLGTDAARQMTSQGGDRELGRALYGVKEHVDDLIGGSIQDPHLAQDYAEARPQYRNYLTLRKPSITNTDTGHVNFRTLGNKLQTSDVSGFLEGNNQSDMYNAARFGRAFLPTVGNSGTATREMGLGNMLMQVPAWIASRAYMSPTFGPLLRAPLIAGHVGGGLLSRVAAPVAPALPYIGLGAMAPSLYDLK